MTEGFVGGVEAGQPRPEGATRYGLHVCRGNWSKRDDVMLEGEYTPLVDAFSRMQVDQLVLEYATPRAGGVAAVAGALAGKELGLGVVNPRTDDVEPASFIEAKIAEAREHLEPERIWLNPDCGFGCFANRCVADHQTATAKITRLVEVARVLRERGA